MLFMIVANYEPQKEKEKIIKMEETEGMTPEGANIIGEWNVIGGGKSFRLVEADDPKAVFAGALAWSHRYKIEIIPVIGTGKARNGGDQ